MLFRSDYKILIVPWKPSGQPFSHTFALHTKKNADDTCDVCLSMLCNRKRLGPGAGLIGKDSHVTVKWADWKELYQECMERIERLFEELERVKSIEKLKMRLYDYFETDTSYPFASNIDVDIDIVFVKEIGGGVRVMSQNPSRAE